MLWKLLWKEAREQLWRGIILTTVALLAVPLGYLLGDRADMSGQSSCDWAATCIFIASLIAPVWISSGFTASERRAGSFDVLLALPVRPVFLFTIKAFAGLVAFMLPMFLGFLAMILCLRHPSFDSRTYSALLLLTPVALYFLLLTFTAPARSESRAAMIGVLALLACIIWGFILVLIYEREAPPLYWLFPNPLLLLLAKHPDAPRATEVLLQLLTLCLWAAAALWRFLRLASNTGTGSEEQQLPITRTLLAPLPHPPLLWKEIREQFSVLAIAFWAAIGVAIISALVEIAESIRYGSNTGFLDIYGLMLQIMLIAGTVAPLLISIVLGVGAVAGDLDERLLHFWSGQPIPIRRWFWTKYLVSAVGILLLLVLPLAIAAGGSSLFDLDGASSRDNVATNLRTQASTAFIAVIVILPLAHALSIFLTALIRRSMYATITAVLILLVLTATPFLNGDNLIHILSHPDPFWPYIALLFCCSVFLAIVLLFSARTLLIRNYRLA
ncbi:MAG: hypothetical protein ACTHN5_14420 [Phycisphaerae bacterium]